MRCHREQSYECNGLVFDVSQVCDFACSQRATVAEACEGHVRQRQTLCSTTSRCKQQKEAGDESLSVLLPSCLPSFALPASRTAATSQELIP